MPIILAQNMLPRDKYFSVIFWLITGKLCSLRKSPDMSVWNLLCGGWENKATFAAGLGFCSVSHSRATPLPPAVSARPWCRGSLETRKSSAGDSPRGLPRGQGRCSAGESGAPRSQTLPAPSFPGGQSCGSGFRPGKELAGAQPWAQRARGHRVPVLQAEPAGAQGAGRESL